MVSYTKPRSTIVSWPVIDSRRHLPASVRLSFSSESSKKSSFLSRGPRIAKATSWRSASGRSSRMEFSSTPLLDSHRPLQYETTFSCNSRDIPTPVMAPYKTYDEETKTDENNNMEAETGMHGGETA